MGGGEGLKHSETKTSAPRSGENFFKNEGFGWEELRRFATRSGEKNFAWAGARRSLPKNGKGILKHNLIQKQES